MLREGIIDFLNNANLVIIPSSSTDISGDLGYRSDVSIDNSVIPYASGGVLYTDKDFYISHDIDDRYYLVYIDAKDTNPIYSSSYDTGTRQFTFTNFDTSGFSIGDKVVITSTGSSNKSSAVIEDVTPTTIKLTVETTFTPTNGVRYKIISNNGVLLCVFSNINPITINSNKVKFGGEVNV
jgi:hypothetical protein